MAEELRELTVRLSLSADNFSRNIKSINQQIKQAEARFKEMGAGSKTFGTSVQGLTARLTMLRERLNMQRASVAQYEQALAKANTSLATARDKHADLEKQLAAERQRQEQLKTAVDQARKAHEDAVKTYGENSDEANALGVELLELESNYKDSGKAVKDLESKLTAQQRTMQNASDKAANWQTRLSEARAEVKNLEKQITNINPHLDAFAAKMDAWATNLGKTGKTMQSVGKALTGYITTPVMALGGFALKASIEFEDAFAGVRKTVDATEEEYRQLEQAVKEMSFEMPSDTTEISEVMATAGQLGIYTENLRDYSKTMIDLGESTDIVANDAAKTIAQFFNITGTGQDKVRNFGSALVDLGNNFTTTESAIMNMASRLAGAGAQIGLTDAQILGFATGLTSVGIEAEAGGSAFSKVMTQMQVAVETNNAALADFARVSGMSSEQFVQAWKQGPADAIQAFIVGLSQMDEEGISAIVTLQEMGLTEIRLRDTLLRATNANKLFARAQETANRAWQENTALTEEAEKRYATTASRLEMLKNRATVAAQELGDELAPAFADTIDWAEDLIDKFMALDTAQKEQIIKWAAIAAAAGPALIVLGKVTTGAGQLFGVLGKVGKGLGEFASKAQAAGGGVKGFASAALGSKAVVAGLTVGLIAGTAALIDYASGAKAARDALEGMERTADEWRAHQAETIFSNDGLAAFGLDKDTFTQSAATAEQWMDGLLKVWSDGKKETDEIVEEWTASFKALNEGTRTSLEELRSQAEESGRTGLAESMQADIDALDAMDAEIEELLKRRQNRNLSDEDKVRLEELIKQREAIQIKYDLVPEDGYEQILQGVQDEVNRAFARGEGDASVSVYAEGLTAAAQGYSAVNEEIDRQYDAERALIDLMEEGEAKQAEYAALDQKYKEDRAAAAREYASALEQMLDPVWESEGIQKANEGMEELFQLFRQYSTVGSEGYQNPEILEQMNALVGELNEDDLISYLGLLQQVQTLLDGGMSEGEVTGIFGEDITSGLDQLAALADFAKERSGELSGLSEILNDLVPEEMQKITIDLDMTAAEERWAEFAENPGAITTDAIIQGYADGEGISVPDVIVNGLVASYQEVEGGASIAALSPDDVVAEVSKYLQAEGYDISALTPDQVTAIVNAYAEATGADKSGLLQALTAKITAYDDSTAVMPSLSAKIAITGYDLEAYNAFVEANPVEVNGILRLSEAGLSPEEVINDPNATFWENGVQIPVDIVPKERIDADTLFVYDEDGTMHVLITPEIQGTAESAQVANDELHVDKGPLAFMGISSDTMDALEDVEERLRHINEEGNTWKYGFGLAVGNSLKGALDPFKKLNVDDWAEVQTFVQETVAALQSGEELDSSLIDDLQTIADLVALLETYDLENNVVSNIGSALEQSGVSLGNGSVSEALQSAIDGAKTVGSDVAAGLGEGMASADLSADAATLATNTEAALRAPGAFDSNSPANLTKPVGQDAALGVGVGMTEANLATYAAIAANNARAALSAALPSSALRPIGLNAMLGLASGIRAGQSSVVSAMRSAARAAVSAAKSALKIKSPSRVFRDEVGVMIMRGLGEGIESEMESQRRIIANAARYLTDVAGNGGTAGGGSSMTTNHDNRNQSSNIYIDTYNANSEEDVDILARKLGRLQRNIARGYGHA